MKTLEALMQELENQIPNFEQSNTTISTASVGWHIAHSYLAIERMCITVSQSDPAHFKKPPFRFLKMVVMLTGRIPRGRGKAPDTVVPKETVTIQIIQERVAAAKSALQQIATAHENGWMNHPIFGILNKKEALRFMQIHTHHHLSIIKDIIK